MLRPQVWTRGFRDEIWSRLDQPWDLVVIGGGITGAGVLGEAVRHGKRALLVEAQDFASGTSSRSTKLVHGGLRYLRQGQFLQTHQCVRERERLIREGAGLVNRVSFSLGTFPGDGMPKWLYGVGLALYDAIAWKWAHESLSREQLLARFEPLKGSAIEGGYRYVDGQVDDARLVIRVLREAVRHGGTAINYAKVDQLLRTADGQVRGVVLRDAAAGASRTAEVQAKVVINATGAWADELRATANQPRHLRKIRGSHLVFKADRLPISGAVSFLHPRDRRAVFAIPWEGVVIAGTTDVDHDQQSNEPAITDGETEYILESLHRAFPSLELKAKDAIATYSGVRPVIDTGKADPSKESREHVVWNENGLVTITGGKLTTFALMARKALNAASAALGPMQARTHVFDANPEGIEWPSSISTEDRFRLLGRFGAEAGEIAADTANAQRIAGSIALWSELRHAARNEGVLTLSDLLMRRVRLGLLLPNGGLDQIARIRGVAQPELGWDDARWDAEEAAYRVRRAESYGPP
jgi:glycerol-3-phosphate dehydrogenase